MAESTDEHGPLAELQARIGYRFADPTRLTEALTHSSALQPGQPRAYERLEFLGDAVLGLAIAEMLIERYPRADEGRLSKYRAALVNAASFAVQAQALALPEHVLLGRGEEKSGGREKASILAAVYEAVIGAVFVDGGYERARAVVAGHFRQAVESVSGRTGIDPKTELQELCQARHGTAPTYRTVDTTGPDHARRFRVEVLLDGVVLGEGEGTSRRNAEREAAHRALRRIETDSAA